MFALEFARLPINLLLVSARPFASTEASMVSVPSSSSRRLAIKICKPEQFQEQASDAWGNFNDLDQRRDVFTIDFGMACQQGV
jgi:hypothetical protein